MLTFTYKATHLSISAALRDYATKRFGEAERFLPKRTDAEYRARIELEKTTQHHQKGDIFRCEVNLTIGKRLLRAEATADDLYKAIDATKDELLTELRKQKQRRVQRRRLSSEAKF